MDYRDMLGQNLEVGDIVAYGGGYRTVTQIAKITDVGEQEEFRWVEDPRLPGGVTLRIVTIPIIKVRNVQRPWEGRCLPYWAHRRKTIDNLKNIIKLDTSTLPPSDILDLVTNGNGN